MDAIELTLSAIDAANAQDPRLVLYEGEEVPQELLHAQRMSSWLAVRQPQASAAQQIAARAHHLQRWLTPRSHFPEGRAGYLRWRSAARERHAVLLGEIAASSGLDAETIARSQAILRKADLANDPEVAVHEDCLCLVFFELQAKELAGNLGASTESVVRKTLKKMTPQGHQLLTTSVLIPVDIRSLVAELLQQMATAEASGA